MARLPITTIGSLYRFSIDLHDSIDRSIQFQREHGVDILSDGEQRSDMVTYFAEAFDGLAVEGGSPIVTGRVNLRTPPQQFSKVKDLEYVLSKHPDLKIKVALTGPTTLGMTCGSKKITSYYKNLLDFRLYKDIAEALAPVAKELADRGAYVQLDEPFLSQGYRDLKERVKLLDEIAQDLPRDKMSVHVCGFVGGQGLIENLLKLENIGSLSFAFAGKVELKNIEHISRKPFEDHDKKLGVGCISVTPMKPEDVGRRESVSSKLQEVASKVGRENLAYAHPDCGMRVTPKSLVPIILDNLRAGVDIFG
jgi:methionine synthase II (cobalamin-independent)